MDDIGITCALACIGVVEVPYIGVNFKHNTGIATHKNVLKSTDQFWGHHPSCPPVQPLLLVLTHYKNTDTHNT